MNYLWDKQSHLFCRSNVQNPAYSDGKDVADRLLTIVADASDRSTFSDELQQAITDRPTEYYLSRARHCLVRPLGIRPGDRVLELGCGCGTVTRYLGELGASVIAVEASRGRARVAAERCRDLANIRVIVDDLHRFKTEEQFDWILLIGVLEYAALFSDQDNPFQHYLHSVTRFLAPEGSIVVAVENKVGLKYLNGCDESHLGIPFYGVQNLYQQRSPRTFTRQELVDLLSSAGLMHSQFFYPFPDYKFPSVILAHEALTASGFDPVDLLVRCQVPDHSGSLYRGFDEALVYAALGNNSLIGELSNSFLVVASPTQNQRPKTGQIATAFSVNRASTFSTQTSITAGEGELHVSKVRLVSGSTKQSFAVTGMNITSKLEDSVYRPGRQILWNLLRARAREGGARPIVEALRPWMNFLLQHARVPAAGLGPSAPDTHRVLSAYVLPGYFLDCTPFNLLQGSDGLFAIDAEWQASSEVSLGWVVTRSSLWCLPIGMPVTDHGVSVREVIEQLCAEHDLSISPQDLQTWLDMESDFQSIVLGHGCQDLTATPTSSGLRSFVSEIAKRGSTLASLNGQLIERQERIADLRRSLEELERSVRLKDKQIAKLDRLITQEQNNVVRLSQSLSQTHQEFKQSKHQLQADVRTAVAEADQLRRELANAQQQLAMLQSSISWRATATLRTLSQHLPGARRLVGRALRLAWWTVTLQLPFRLRDRRRLFQTRDLIAASDFFDADWYRNQYGDVAVSDCDPASHYAMFGGRERRNPGPRFDAGWYLDHNSDIAGNATNPLVHYLTFGIAEGRQIRAVPELEKTIARASSPEPTQSYETWIERFDTFTDEDVAAIRRHLASLGSIPLVSVVMKVDQADPVLLRKALDSITGQLYSRWELCVVGTGSSGPEIGSILEDYASRDRRIKVALPNTNGDSGMAGNIGVEMATGDFVALVGGEDELAIHALYMLAVELNEHPETDMIYSDEDKIDVDGRRHEPHFKAAWSREFFYSQNLMDHLAVYRTSLVKDTGGFREGFAGNEEYDLVLRMLVRTAPERIRHIPHVLYRKRSKDDIVRPPISPGPTLEEAGRRALTEYFAAKGELARVVSDPSGRLNRVIYPLPDPAPHISLIVPTRDKLPLLRNCVDGILQRTRYPNFELIIVDNDSCEPGTLKYFESLRDEGRVRILHVGGPFNYAALNNQAVSCAKSELIGFINNDIEVIEPGWLEEMASQAIQPGVGAVGAKLYYRDDTIQHAGVVLGMGEVAGHVHKHLPRSASGYLGRLRMVHNVSCVTAACMVLPREVFIEVGGFDEANLKVAYNDVDLCLKIREAGYGIVWTPYAELYHLESASRGVGSAPDNFEREIREGSHLKQRWGAWLRADPFYSPNLTLRDPSLSGESDLAFPPRASKPWRQWKSMADPRQAVEASRDSGDATPELSEVFSYVATPIDPSALPARVAIGVSSQGNFFMTEIALMLQDAFHQLRVPARTFTEFEVHGVSSDETVVIVAPHEFFLLGKGVHALAALRHVHTLVMLNTEQPQTSWFAAGEPYLRQASAVLDLNYESARHLVRSGYKALVLPLGYSEYIARRFDGRVLPEHELLKHMPSRVLSEMPTAYSDRPIDILFVGTSSPRRQAFFAQNARFFAGKNTFIYMPDGDKPFVANEPRTIDFSTFAALVRRSKVMLNLHRDDVPYLEWQRIVTLGIMQKTLVVTEHCQRAPCIEPNIDYLDGELQTLPAFCEFALTNLQMAEEIADRAYRRLQSLYPMQQILGRCWTALVSRIGAMTC